MDSRLSDILVNPVDVTSSSGRYCALVGPGAINRLGPELARILRPARATIITDETVGTLYAERARSAIHTAGIESIVLTVPAGEASKAFGQAAMLFDRLAERRHERNEPIIALGGGVVGDLAGFVAATWMRGTPWAVCPTTLEAMIDASIGGKTGVNHPAGKNLIGAFHQPVLVCSDVDCLRTLSPRDITAGLAESVKHAVIADERFLQWHEANIDAIRAREPATLTELIVRNVRIKAAVVADDEREQAADRVGRAALNFGHTIGHAIESESNFSLRHGEAVALGMIAELRLAEARVGLATADRVRIETLLRAFGLPSTCPMELDRNAVLQRLALDKKARSGVVRWVVPARIGETQWLTDVSRRDLDAALDVVLPPGRSGN